MTVSEMQSLMDLGPDGWRMFLYLGDAPRDDRPADMEFIVTTPRVGPGPPGYFTLEYFDPGWEHMLVTLVAPPVTLERPGPGILLEAKRPDDSWWRFSTITLTDYMKARLREHRAFLGYSYFGEAA